MYKITKDNLKLALKESLNEELKKEYKTLSFVDKIFKEAKDHVKNIKKLIIENKKNSPEIVHSYLLHECNCCSGYNKLAQKTGYEPEEQLLYDITDEDYWINNSDIKEEYEDEDYYNDYDDSRIESARADFIEKYDSEPSDDQLLDFIHDQNIDREEGKEETIIDDQINDNLFETPSFWSAVKENEIKISKKPLSESKVNLMKNKGYNVTAFMTEEEMNNFLTNR